MIFDKFTLSLITAILGFGIWNIQRFMEDRKNTHAKVLKQDNLVRDIYAEIDFNTTDMEIFLTKSPSLPVLRIQLGFYHYHAQQLAMNQKRFL